VHHGAAAAGGRLFFAAAAPLELLSIGRLMLISDSLAASPTNSSACYPSIGFVHIPKSGGTTVAGALLSCAALKNKVLLPSTHDPHPLFHTPLLKQRDKYGAAAWDEAYTFAIVRNPFSWTVSQFFYSMESHCPPSRGDRNRWYPACEYKSAVLDHNGNVRAFEEKHRAFFTAWLVEHDELAAGTKPFLAPNLISNQAAGWTNGTSQLSWVVNQSSRAAGSLVRHIVRLEDAGDFNRHATCQGLQAFLCGNSASSQREAHGHEPEAVAAKTWTSGHAASSAYYTPRACEIVQRRFAIDFATFGYRMEECVGAHPAAVASAELEMLPSATASPSLKLPSRAVQADGGAFWGALSAHPPFVAVGVALLLLLTLPVVLARSQFGGCCSRHRGSQPTRLSQHEREEECAAVDQEDEEVSEAELREDAPSEEPAQCAFGQPPV